MAKKFLKGFILITFGVLIVGVLVNAAQYYRVNNGTTVTINEWSVCKKVTNNTGKDIFVPTNTSNEWNQFRTYFPSGISLGTCDTPPPPSPTCSCPSGWWYCAPMCCYGTCGCNVSCLQNKCAAFCSSVGAIVSHNCTSASDTCKCNISPYSALCSNWGTCQSCL